MLGRKPDYDPVEDNIVRVRARQLRKKVEDYFADEGLWEPVVMSIPKGHYIPLFQPKLSERSPAAPDAAIAGADQPKLSGRRLSIRAAAPWLVAVLSLSALFVVVWRQRGTRTSLVPETPTARIARGVWNQLSSAPDHEITVVTADAGFALWQDLTHHTVSLGEYLSRRYLRDETTNPDLREIAVRRHTSSADLNVTLRLAETARTFGGRLKVKFARNVDIHDLRTGNVMLLGSRRSNPWVQLFESQLNFFLSDEASLSGPSFRNKSPKPGEPKVFSISSRLEVQGAEDTSMESYAVAALLPSPSGTGVVAIIEGLSMEGTEAAGELVTNLEKFGTLLRRIGVKNDQPVKPFEMLLKLTAVPGGYGDAELIAYRYPVP